MEVRIINYLFDLYFSRSNVSEVVISFCWTWLTVLSSEVIVVVLCIRKLRLYIVRTPLWLTVRYFVRSHLKFPNFSMLHTRNWCHLDLIFQRLFSFQPYNYWYTLKMLHEDLPTFFFDVSLIFYETLCTFVCFCIIFLQEILFRYRYLWI